MNMFGSSLGAASPDAAFEGSMVGSEGSGAPTMAFCDGFPRGAVRVFCKAPGRPRGLLSGADGLSPTIMPGSSTFSRIFIVLADAGRRGLSSEGGVGLRSTSPAGAFPDFLAPLDFSRFRPRAEKLPEVVGGGLFGMAADTGRLASAWPLGFLTFGEAWPPESPCTLAPAEGPSASSEPPACALAPELKDSGGELATSGCDPERMPMGLALGAAGFPRRMRCADGRCSSGEPDGTCSSADSADSAPLTLSPRRRRDVESGFALSPRRRRRKNGV